ncbi:MAG: Low affinity immunoglobulin epsilon Fc receptor [Myxococcales bacterium]|nr:Low affinity immunoglobulin epsilon Fc receptor [Myxococcales bacterium]
MLARHAADFDTRGVADGSNGSNGSNVDAPRLLIDAPVFAFDAGQCPPSYSRVATSCYRVSIANGGWLPGELACEADAVGAHLVVIDDAAEDTTIKTTYSMTIRTWIGLSKRQTSLYRTVIDTAGYRDLTSPQSESSEACAALDNNGQMGTHTCGDSNRFICEYDGKPAVPSSY